MGVDWETLCLYNPPHPVGMSDDHVRGSINVFPSNLFDAILLSVFFSLQLSSLSLVQPQPVMREKEWIGNESVRVRALAQSGFRTIYLEGRQQKVRDLNDML